MTSIHTRSRSSPAWGTEPQRAIQRPSLAPIKTCDDFDRRWSTVVPPNSRALTFVAIFDPDEGMIGFSGSSLLPLDFKDLPRTPAPYKSLPSLPQTPGYPHDAEDSQTLTAGTCTPALSMDSTSTLRDMQAFLDTYHQGGTRWGADDELVTRGFNKEVPRASSTLMGHHKRASCTAVCDDARRESGCYMDQEEGSYDERFEDSGYASAATEDENSNIRESFERPQVDSFFVYDEYPFKSDNERSHFSVTTTSTSRYVPIESPATPEPPATPHSITFRPHAPEPYTPDSDRSSPCEEDEDEDGLDFLSFVKPRPQLPHHWHSSPPTTMPRRPNKLFKNRSASAVSLRTHTSSPVARPDVVLARDAYNFGGRSPRATSPSTSPSSYSPPKPSLTRVLSKGMLRIRKPSISSMVPLRRPSADAHVVQQDGHSEPQNGEDTNWVRVDIEWVPNITQNDVDEI